MKKLILASLLPLTLNAIPMDGFPIKDTNRTYSKPKEEVKQELPEVKSYKQEVLELWDACSKECSNNCYSDAKATSTYTIDSLIELDLRELIIPIHSAQVINKYVYVKQVFENLQTIQDCEIRKMLFGVLYREVSRKYIVHRTLSETEEPTIIYYMD